LPSPAPQPMAVARKLVPLASMGMMRSRFSPQSRLAASSTTNAATSAASDGIETSPATNGPSRGPRALPQLSPLTALGPRAVPPVANITNDEEDSD